MFNKQSLRKYKKNYGRHSLLGEHRNRKKCELLKTTNLGANFN